jgi:hypothetical protein
MSHPVLTAMRDAIQTDPGNRGLATDPHDNLFTACAGDFEEACRSIADESRPALAIVTGFLIAHADPPCGETDGPLGALFLARALAPAGVRVAVLTDSHSQAALAAGLAACDLSDHVPLLTLPQPSHPWDDWFARDWKAFVTEAFRPTHLLALERPGPSRVTDRCHNMRGVDITRYTCPAHLLFEDASRQFPRLQTIGIGDGGNEIGMGKIPGATIQRNVPNGGQIACRVPTDHLIVAGVSNWGAYALAAGVRYLRGVAHDSTLFDPEHERKLLELMVERGPLVDGPSGKRQATVDGLTFEEYSKPLVQLGAILRG